MTLNSYSKMKECKCKTVQKLKNECVSIITTSKAKLLDEGELG